MCLSFLYPRKGLIAIDARQFTVSNFSAEESGSHHKLKNTKDNRFLQMKHSVITFCATSQKQASQVATGAGPGKILTTAQISPSTRFKDFLFWRPKSEERKLLGW